MESIIKKALEREEKEKNNKNKSDKDNAKKTQSGKDTKNVNEAKKEGSSIKKGKTSTDKELENILSNRKARIVVVGCGGAGNNTITRMHQVGIEGVTMVAVNTDAQDLLYADADVKVLIGKEITNGLGAGANPQVGEAAAKESREDIKKAIGKADLVFVTAGMGGGTGTGSAPIVAEVAKKEGALVVGVVTLPFEMEGKHRMENARMGLSKMEEFVDTLIIIPNDKLLELVPDVSINTAFKVADEILVNAVKGIAELITKPALINLDFADVNAVMGKGGLAMIGIGQSDTESRAREAVQKALHNPLLEVDVEGAKGALIHVAGGADLTLKEAKEVVEGVTSKLDPDARVIWGAMIDPDLGDSLRVMVVVTGVESPYHEDFTQKVDDARKKEIEEKLGVEFL